MAFRNEEAALRARIEVLERELASLRDVAEERDRLKARIEELEKQLGFDEARKRRVEEERATARARARRERAKRVRAWLSAIGGPRVPLAIGGVLLAGAVAWSASGFFCGPSQSAAPSIGMVDLDRDPAPVLPQMSTRGAQSTPSGCAGFVPRAPHLVLRSSTPVALRVAPEATSGGDLVLLVVGPDGRVECNDDGGDSLNPLVSMVVPAGDTRVWVGTYEMGSGVDFTLSITATPTGVAPDASGLASTAPPTAGVVEGPDATRVLTGSARSITAASTIDSSCRGFLPLEPQAVLRLSRQAAVRLHASAGGLDLVLLVRGPDGSVRCDDDSGRGNEPLVATLLPAGEHGVWVGTYSERAEPFSFTLDASVLALPSGESVAPRRLGTGEELTIEGVTRDLVSPSAIGAPCGNGLIGVEPDVALQLDEPREIALALASSSAPYAVVEHPEGRFECVTTALQRRRWEAGVHRVYAGVPSESSPGPFTLTLRAMPSSVQPWSPR